MPLNLPNLITWLRIILIPLIVGVYYLPDDWLPMPGKNLAATTIFVFAAVTDWLDGYLARKLNQMSAFGAFLDPVADKLMVVGALIVLLQLDRVESAVALDHRRARNRDFRAAGMDGQDRQGEERGGGVHWARSRP